MYRRVPTPGDGWAMTTIGTASKSMAIASRVA